jgi:hypothetical protein
MADTPRTRHAGWLEVLESPTGRRTLPDAVTGEKSFGSCACWQPVAAIYWTAFQTARICILRGRPTFETRRQKGRDQKPLLISAVACIAQRKSVMIPMHDLTSHVCGSVQGIGPLRSFATTENNKSLGRRQAKPSHSHLLFQVRL